MGGGVEGGENNRTVFSRGFVLRVDGQDEASVIERIAKFVDPLSSCLACIKQRAHDRGYDLARDRDPLLVREKHRWFATLDGPEINFHQRARTLGGCRPLLTCFHRRTRLLSLRSLLTSRFSSSLPSLLRIVHTDPAVRGSFRKPRFLAPSFLKIFSPYIDTKLPFSLSRFLFFLPASPRPGIVQVYLYSPGTRRWLRSRLNLYHDHRLRGSSSNALYSTCSLRSSIFSYVIRKIIIPGGWEFRNRAIQRYLSLVTTTIFRGNRMIIPSFYDFSHHHSLRELWSRIDQRILRKERME